MTLLMYMVADGGRRGYSLLLGDFWDEARAFGLSLPTAEPVSAPSFCSARNKITPELLRHLLYEVVGLSLEDSFSDRRWHGRRVFAVDGSKIPVQRSEELEFAFGVPDQGHCPQILLSVLLDVCAKMPVDLEIGPYGSCERGHLLAMLASLAKGDILVLDRGYPSHEVLQALAAAEVDFLIRVPASHSFAAIDELRQDGRDDGTFWFEPPDGSPDEWKPLELRVVRIAGPDGSESFFVTSLKRSKFSRRQLRELYHMRWEAEEFYKLLKGPYIGQGQFRSKSAEGVKQEVHALVLFLAIARVLAATTAQAAGLEYDEVSQKAAVLGLASYITRLFLESSDPELPLRELRALLQRIARTPYKPRPGRSSPRRSFKPRRKWGAGGRNGG